MNPNVILTEIDLECCGLFATLQSILGAGAAVGAQSSAGLNISHIRGGFSGLLSKKQINPFCFVRSINILPNFTRLVLIDSELSSLSIDTGLVKFGEIFIDFARQKRLVLFFRRPGKLSKMCKIFNPGFGV